MHSHHGKVSQFLTAMAKTWVTSGICPKFTHLGHDYLKVIKFVRLKSLFLMNKPHESVGQGE